LKELATLLLEINCRAQFIRQPLIHTSIISCVARQHAHVYKCVMNEDAKIRTNGPLLQVLHDRSCNIPQTRPVVQ